MIPFFQEQFIVYWLGENCLFRYAEIVLHCRWDLPLDTGFGGQGDSKYHISCPGAGKMISGCVSALDKHNHISSHLLKTPSATSSNGHTNTRTHTSCIYLQYFASQCLHGDVVLIVSCYTSGFMSLWLEFSLRFGLKNSIRGPDSCCFSLIYLYLFFIFQTRSQSSRIHQ